MILEKIAEREAQEAAEGPRDIIGGGAPEDAVELPARVVEVYTQYVLQFAFRPLSLTVEQSRAYPFALQVWQASEALQNLAFAS